MPHDGKNSTVEQVLQFVPMVWFTSFHFTSTTGRNLLSRMSTTCFDRCRCNTLLGWPHSSQRLRHAQGTLPSEVADEVAHLRSRATATAAPSRSGDRGYGCPSAHNGDTRVTSQQPVAVPGRHLRQGQAGAHLVQH